VIKRVITYRVLIFNTLIALIKYNLYHLFLRDEKMVKLISARQSHLVPDYSIPVQPNTLLLRQTNRLINLIQPGASCLVKSLVKRDVLEKFGYNSVICFGLMKQNGGFIAHSWLTVENSGGFSKVFQLS